MTVEAKTTDAELCRRIVAGRAAESELIERHTGMVGDIVKKLTLPGCVERSDLMQIGLIALVRAASKWKPDRVNEKTGKPIQFNTYAHVCIENDIRRQAGVLIEKSRNYPSYPHEFADGFDPLDLLPAPPDQPGPPPGVREGVGRLPPTLRVVVVMHYGLEGQPAEWRDVAAATGLTIPQAKRALEVALNQL